MRFAWQSSFMPQQIQQREIGRRSSPDGIAKDLAVAYYTGTGRSLDRDLLDLRRDPNSYICVEANLVALLRPVPRDSSLEQIVDLACVFPLESCDSWHVHFLAGDLAFARRLAHELLPLKWFCYQRGKRSPRLIFRSRESILQPINK